MQGEETTAICVLSTFERNEKRACLRRLECKRGLPSLPMRTRARWSLARSSPLMVPSAKVPDGCRDECVVGRVS